MARARFNLANAGDNFDQETGAYTRGPGQGYGPRREAWSATSSVADKPDDRVASLMVQAYSALGEGVQAPCARRR